MSGSFVYSQTETGIVFCPFDGTPMFQLGVCDWCKPHYRCPICGKTFFGDEEFFQICNFPGSHTIKKGEKENGTGI